MQLIPHIVNCNLIVIPQLYLFLHTLYLLLSSINLSQAYQMINLKDQLFGSVIKRKYSGMTKETVFHDI
jgi:hypothetical protein